MKIATFVMCCMLPFLSGCWTRTVVPERPRERVNWAEVRAKTDELTTPRDVEGPIKNRGQAKVWKDSWDLNLYLELAHNGSEGDKRRAREYWHTVIDRMEELEKPRCKWYVVRREFCRSR